MQVRKYILQQMFLQPAVRLERQCFTGYVWYNGSGAVNYYVKIIRNSSGEAVGYIAENAAGESETYIYEKSVLGDIIAVWSSDGTEVLTYAYDAWGNTTSAVAGTGTTAEAAAQKALELNPFTYRGYQYDVESGLYYLQSRYYNPVYGRFLNADEIKNINVFASKLAGVLKNNLFAYCVNNPLAYTDATGEKRKGKNSLERAISGVFLLLMISNSDECFEIGFDDKQSQKGRIAIHISKQMDYNGNKLTFSDMLYEFYSFIEEDVFDIMGRYATAKFYEYFPDEFYKIMKSQTGKREFLFSDECVSEEIKHHCLGYWWSVGKIPLPKTSYRLLIGVFGRKSEMKKHCETIDIAEKDAIKIKDRTAFGYFSGIRDCYKCTNADPYWQGGRIRTYQNVRNTWKNNKIEV